MKSAGYGKHASLPQGTTAAVRWLNCQPDVTRLILGPYRRGKMRNTGELMVVGPCRGGLQLLARGQSIGLHLYAHTPDPEGLARRVATRFGRAS